MNRTFLATGEAALVAWAEANAAVLAVVLTGSRARPGGADDHSDLDLLILVAAPPADLVATIPPIDGTVLTSRQPYGSDEYDISIVGPDFSRLDITLMRTTTTTSVREAVAPVAGPKQLWRGYRVLFDRMAHRDHALPPRLVHSVPDPATLETMASQFWVQSLRAAVFILRGDLWRAQTLLVCRLRSIWGRLAEWDAQLGQLPGHDTWYDGRHIDSWAREPVRDAVPTLFATYDRKSMAAALLAMGASFAMMFDRLGQSLYVAPPTDGGALQHIETLLKAIDA